MLSLRSFCPLQARQILHSSSRLKASRQPIRRSLATMALTDIKSRRRKDYGYSMEYRTRWQGPRCSHISKEEISNYIFRSDNDMYDHMNNSIYYFLFDSVVNTYLITHCALHPPTSTQVGLVVHSHCDYFAPTGFPALVDLALRVNKLGKSSVTYEIGVFERGTEEPKAVGGKTIGRRKGEVMMILAIHDWIKRHVDYEMMKMFDCKKVAMAINLLGQYQCSQAWISYLKFQMQVVCYPGTPSCRNQEERSIQKKKGRPHVSRIYHNLPLFFFFWLSSNLCPAKAPASAPIMVCPPAFLPP